MSEIIAAIIIAIGTILSGIYAKKPVEKILGKLKISSPSNKKWWFINIFLGVIIIALILTIFWSTWYVLDSGNYHLGDNVFRLDQLERPTFQAPNGTNKDALILWNKDSGEFESNSFYTRYPNPEQWKHLELERYSEVYSGTYYLGKLVIGYTKTFDLRDILSNIRRITSPKLLVVDFEVFDLSHGETGGELMFILNNSSFTTRVTCQDNYTKYRWGKIVPIEIPLSLLNYDLNTIYLFVWPKFTYQEGIKYYHFEDVEIRNIKLKIE